MRTLRLLTVLIPALTFAAGLTSLQGQGNRRTDLRNPAIVGLPGIDSISKPTCVRSLIVDRVTAME